jgi:hypothetical protein
MPSWSIHTLHDVTGFARDTIAKRLEGMPCERDGEHANAAKLYESRAALQRIYYGDSEDKGRVLTAQEAARDLAIKRTEEIDLKLEILRGERPKLSDVTEALEDIAAEITGIVKGSELEDERKADIVQAVKDAVRRATQAQPEVEA